MLPIELYKIIASLVETLQCFQSLSLVCKNSSIGCRLYIEEAERRSHINVQIAYNFTGHWGDLNWEFGHLPLPVLHPEFSNAIHRTHIGCDNVEEDSRCSTHSRYYVPYRGAATWNGQREWNVEKPSYDYKY